jgi:16S rRNA (guanine527-N7)-methyltransferase
MSLEIKKNIALENLEKFNKLTIQETKNLEDFVLFLLQENQNFNFIGKSTVSDIWERHVLDSAQILQFIENKNFKFADFGSGSGFPGIILSILGLREIHLIEKSFRKCEFLRQAKQFSNNRIFIHQINLEELSTTGFDCIVSRAFAPLETLIDYAKRFLKKDGFCLFLKGKNLENEIKIAKEKFKFEYSLHQSITSSESNIIKILNIS